MISARTGVRMGVWLLLFLCAPVLSEFDVGLDKYWKEWKQTYKRSYPNEVEELGRRALWEKNVMKVDHHNMEANMGIHTYTLAINQFSDMTKEEMMKTYANLRVPSNSICQEPAHFRGRNKKLPKTVDWTKKKRVTSVKNQGGCGSCWAFSTVGALEGLLANTTGKLVDLSPQNLVDCAGGTYGNFGCNGGWMHDALRYVKDKGIMSEKDYPYKAKDDTCHYKASKVVFKISNYICVPENEVSLQKACAEVGPIAVAINAADLFDYESGVFNKTCESTLNHGVLLVGYGTDKTTGLDYWKIKNSWGDGWGEQGYLRLARNKKKMCGISTYSVYPVL